MMNIPETFPYYCKDLKQILDEVESQLEEKIVLPIKSINNEHNALIDALWNKELFNKLSR